ncbi:glycoside hydrolase family 95 protein [Pedobacter sp. KR3-3]|uniref:Glycoside hydrolase family 95 protein n=1 Tax=Pedobacter albus TaxID=3113905 RepID=A0ABU7I7D9_9SPHI|nr:glycoside hydrolase family 95 protein [Pedobacter sp. KR3-3]MEE1945277.1 glycoside hydrolase family 95 protein [Pedobacter sp. KR3-3]
MKKYIFLFLSFFALSATAQVKEPLKLWYTAPAKIWEEALALGNGKNGAMVFGRVNRERIQLNNATLWSGYPDAGNNPKGVEALPQVRKAIFEGDYGKAATLWKQNLQGTYSARYLTMADLFLDFGLGDSTTTNYNRTLDLNTAVHSVTYKINGINYKRETLVSYPDKVLAIRITADKQNAISFTTSLTSKLRYQTAAVQSNYLVLKGKAPKHVAHRATEPQQIVYDDKEGMNFEVHLKLKNEGGSVTANGRDIKVSKANAVTIYLTSGTSFNGFDKSPGLAGVDPAIEAKANLKNAEAKSFATLKAAHLADYQKLFNRVSFNLQADPALVKLPTNIRLSRQGQNGNDQGLQTLYYQFGRYLMIASSRQGGQATNLQGIWNDAVQPPWGSNYTVNANTQMNYWLAENTNLSELHQPLFDFIARLAKNGAVTAKVNYGINQGWVVHHNSDIWAKTSPSGGYDWDPKSAARWSAWPMGGAWLSTHLYEHYLFTGDKIFLKEKSYPLMKGAAEFMLHWLVEDKNGYLVTNPSTSPENVFNVNGRDYEMSMASTMDMSIIKELFADCIAAAEALNIDKEFVAKLVKAKAKLYPYQIGQYGQLQEWFNDLDNPKDTHRHLSHLFGLYPGQQIDPLNTPELAAAAKQSLIYRGDVSTGWSMAWKINWWARLLDGDHSLKILKAGLTLIDPAKTVEPVTPTNPQAQLTNVQMSGGGTYPNMFDAHPPFQIDGNFGATAGITEMLLQSHNGELYLLPALPNEWTMGSINGIKARGNFTVNINWKDNKLTHAIITSNIGGNCRLRTNFPVKIVETASHNATNLSPDHKTGEFKQNGNTKLLELPVAKSYVIDFNTLKGRSYTVVPL